ncbi:EscR/YscR/HrcR family type III secretion system export apparatus protein [Pseudomonas gingeri]|uniref:EscR/YscR/HrcR family type III secretion system export apparatus protein n=1 Tax=Pseudomonas gingeri TaxID=117681 RepID=A0A7Y7Y8A8_9PSED|nr:EscR/YscR/HrcR family type III secretion system export apparatus protein [Pseudomonas gingeri]NVZ99857.1 EscR/YscR/HrcR family type III secretion system export apparatus protein [Pseudomonas gingeri]NWA16697.1 EscR/YscR/HrcR family type III secretion system export apparatus protein [Pseudomonas gingeri]NWA53917.1 EscR/YscR/HrcR family type III secretion system export apparatus protein [Pseudomonas gingeri]NWA94149.1 EscR/YscR/HrcR family type III secretion system export apparatus protein [Ps
MNNDVSLIALLAFASLLPFLVAAGTCYIKFSIVFVIVRNALGLQQVPSNMSLNAIALLLALFVMTPVVQQGYGYYKDNQVRFDSVEAVIEFSENGLGGYKDYLRRYTDPELAFFFERAQQVDADGAGSLSREEVEPSLFALLPAYALSEIKSAFKIGFYLYLPFVIVDLVISSILLALGMMMMSPVIISVPIKLVLFVALDGWALLSTGLVRQYLTLLE